MRAPEFTAALQAFGRGVLGLRISANLTQEELGRRCGLHRSYISHVEQGIQNLSLTNIVRLAEGLELDPSDLMAPLRRFSDGLTTGQP